MEVLQYVVSFLGGGAIGAVVSSLHAGALARRQREADQIGRQLEVLYGPLAFFVAQNEKLSALCGDIRSAFQAEFVATKWSTAKSTRDALRKDADDTIAVSNEYAGLIAANNRRVMEILERGWHLIDKEDAEEFAQFQVDYARHKTEFEGALRMPLAIHTAVGEIPFVRPSMMQRMKRAADQKSR